MKIDIIKPGIMTRLSHLIFLQVVFIFLALALILFFPSDNSYSNANISTMRQSVASLAQSLETELFNRSDSISATAKNDIIFRLLKRSNICNIAFVEPEHDTDSINLIGEWNATKDIENTVLADSDKSLISGIDKSIVRHVANDEPGFILATMIEAQRSVFYTHLNTGKTPPIILVAAVKHDLVITSRSGLLYAIFLLFLVSALLALLIVYLIAKRLKNPLTGLMEEMKGHNTEQSDKKFNRNDDKVVRQLTQSFSSMSRTLKDNRKTMEDYDNKLSKVNASLVHSQAFLATLVDCSPVSIIVTDTDGYVTLCNRAASKDFGITSNKLIGSNISDLIQASPDSGTGQTKYENDEPGFEAVCKRGDNDYYPAYVIRNTIPAVDDMPSSILYMLNDISESHAFQEMMVRVDRYCTRGEMAGDIAHEINNYLAILSGNVELMPILLKRGDQEKIDKKLELMKTTVDRVAHFANGLMDASPEDAVFELGSLNQIAENVIAFLKPQNRFDHVTFSAHLDPQIPAMRFDFGQIQQTLVNLVFNASDSLKDKEGDAKIHFVTGSRTIDGEMHAFVEVHDNGEGVPEQNVEALFKKRFSTKRKGHGIGLVTCQRIIEAHNGLMEYRFDEGAVFVFLLPVSNKVTEKSNSQHSEPSHA